MMYSDASRVVRARQWSGCRTQDICQCLQDYIDSPPMSKQSWCASARTQAVRHAATNFAAHSHQTVAGDMPSTLVVKAKCQCPTACNQLAHQDCPVEQPRPPRESSRQSTWPVESLKCSLMLLQPAPMLQVCSQGKDACIMLLQIRSDMPQPGIPRTRGVLRDTACRSASTSCTFRS